MKKSEITKGMRIAVVDHRSLGGHFQTVKEIYGEDHGHYACREYWEAVVVDPDVRFRPAIGGSPNTPGIRVKVVAHWRDGVRCGDRKFQPQDGAFDEDGTICIPRRLAVAQFGAQIRLRTKAEAIAKANEEVRAGEAAARDRLVERLKELGVNAGIRTPYSWGGETKERLVAVGDVDALLTLLEGVEPLGAEPEEARSAIAATLGPVA